MADFNLSDDPLDGVFWESVMSDPALFSAITGLRDALSAPPREALRSIQIAAAADAAAAATPVVGAASADLIVGRPSFWARRTAIVSSLATGVFFKVAVGALALTTAGGGVAAAAGMLPGPAQAAAADTLQFIGLKIPHPDDLEEPIDDELDGPVVVPATVTTTATGDEPTTNSPMSDVEDDDDQGHDEPSITTTGPNDEDDDDQQSDDQSTPATTPDDEDDDDQGDEEPATTTTPNDDEDDDDRGDEEPATTTAPNDDDDGGADDDQGGDDEGNGGADDDQGGDDEGIAGADDDQGGDDQ